jgi:hypothetical protein
MDKGVPHYSLPTIQAVVAAQGEQAFTKTAQRGVKMLLLTIEEAVGVVLALNSRTHYLQEHDH